MPKNTKVHRLYDALVKKGYTRASAARISQSRTRKSLKTGRKPKGR